MNKFEKGKFYRVSGCHTLCIQVTERTDARITFNLIDSEIGKVLSFHTRKVKEFEAEDTEYIFTAQFDAKFHLSVYAKNEFSAPESIKVKN